MTDIAQYTPNVAVVTGAAQGIGKAIALRLAADGFSVVVSDLASKQDLLGILAEEIKTKGGKALVQPTDVTREDEIVKLVDRTVQELGGIDVMVANAGIAIIKPFLEMSAEEYDSVMSVNARGVMLCYKHAALQMVKQKRGGRILGASSILGREGKAASAMGYVASKFAVRGLTQALSVEMAPHKVTVNAYCPGLILTPMVDIPSIDPQIGTGTPGSFVRQVCGMSPDAPGGEPEVVASLISYLCKPEAHFITGQSISTCGGVSFS